jgi:hypothetical protein
MQGHHFRLKALLLAVLDKLTHRLLGTAAPEVVDNMQNPISCGLICQTQAYFLVAHSNAKASCGKQTNEIKSQQASHQGQKIKRATS